MTCRWQCEIGEFCRRVLRQHWLDVPRHDDVRTFPPPDLDRWRVDVIVGGDPCQENSRARITSGTRSPSLGHEFVRVVDVLRPRVVVRENPARVRRDAPWPWWRMRAALEGIGYVVLPFRLRACCFGAVHERDRLFLLAALPDANGVGLRGEGRPAADGPPPAGEGAGRERQRVRADVRAVGGGLLLHPNRERLQGIDRDREPPEHTRRTTPRVVRRAGPDGVPAPRVCRSRHEVPDFVDRITALGNAIVPDVAEWIGRRIVRCLEG